MIESGLLFEIQRLQFSERSRAEAMLLDFVRDMFPHLNVMSLELRPQAISLNSFNGFLTLADKGRLFFKTHVEQDNVISEYYNAAMLADAGYPVVQPLYVSQQSGQQLLIYPIIESPSVFDVARRIERDGAFKSDDMARLIQAQQRSDDDLLRIYEATLRRTDGGEASRAPIHQLFWHRLTGGRFRRFYDDYAKFDLPHGQFTATDVLDVRWEINGAIYGESLRTLVERAVTVLDPTRPTYTVVGHGDAHNGNVFHTDDGLVYFDPAFAGRHSPLLDLVKPLFHNVYAMWMYFPEEEREKLRISIAVSGKTWRLHHDYANNALRKAFFDSKFERVFIPALRMLRDRSGLPPDWRDSVKLALMCCPLLTMNLTTFPPEIALLGLGFAIQMGAESAGARSEIDIALDRAEKALTE